MALNIIKRIDQGGLLPRFYGVAWFDDWRTHSAVCLPVPINVLARVLRDAWLYLAHPSQSVPFNPRAAYWQGRREGAQAAQQDFLDKE